MRRILTTLGVFSSLTMPVSGSGAETASVVRWDEKIQVASGDAYQGPWRMNASDFRYVDDPAVAIDGAGNIGVVWGDQSRQDLFFQLYDTGGQPRFEEPVRVSHSPDVFSWLPRILLSPQPGPPEEIFVLWQEIVFSGGSHGGEIYFARSTDGGRSFGKAINLSNSPAGAGKGRVTPDRWHNGSLDLAKGPDGTLYAVWTEYEGKLWLSHSRDRGQSFSDPLQIAGCHDQPARGPSLAVDTDGTLHLAWTEGGDIHYAALRNGAETFERPRRIGAGSGHADAPKLVTDRRRTVHLVYAESPAGPFQNYRILYSRFPRGSPEFDPPREIPAFPSDGFRSASFPAITLGKKEQLCVIWELFPARAQRPMGIGFTTSSNGGDTFSAPTVVPGTGDPELGENGSRQGLLMKKIDADSTGEIALVNSTFRSRAGSAIWLIPGRFDP